MHEKTDNLQIAISNLEKDVSYIKDFLERYDKDYKIIDKSLIQDIYQSLIDVEERASTIEATINEIVDWNESIEAKIELLMRLASGQDVRMQIVNILREYENDGFDEGEQL